MSFKDLGKGNVGQRTAEETKARAEAAAAAKAKHDAKHTRHIGPDEGAKRGEPESKGGSSRR